MRRDEEITARKEPVVARAVREGWEFTLDRVLDDLSGDIRLIKSVKVPRGSKCIRASVNRNPDPMVEDDRRYEGTAGFVNGRTFGIEAETLSDAIDKADAILADLAVGRMPMPVTRSVYA